MQLDSQKLCLNISSQLKPSCLPTDSCMKTINGAGLVLQETDLSLTVRYGGSVIDLNNPSVSVRDLTRLI